MDTERVLHLPTGERITILRTSDETDGAVFELEAILPPRLSGPPAHLHQVEHETFEVIEGTLRVRLGPVMRDLGPGESMTVTPGTVHAFSNPSAMPTRLITREAPAGQLEAQLRAMSSAGRIPPLLRLAQINARHDMSFLLHGMPEAPQVLLWHALAGMARCRDRASAHTS